MTTVQTCRIESELLSICQYQLSNIWIDQKVISMLTKLYYKESNFSYNSNSILKGLLRICSHEKDIEDKGRGRRGAVKQHTDEFYGHRDALERFKVIRTRARPISTRVASMGDLLCLFTGAPPSGRGLTGNDTKIGSM